MNRVLQAAGRVIRTENDRGIVVLLDDRYATEQYKAMFPLHWSHAKYVHSAQELRGTRRGVLVHASVVSRGDEVRAACEGALGEGAKLDGLVAHHIGVGREAVRIGVHEVVHDGALVLLLAVPALELNA